MRARLWTTFALGLSFCLVGPASATPDDPVVIHVGKQTLSASQVESRLRSIPRLHLDTHASRGDARVGFVENVLVSELLLAEAARDDRIDKAPHVADRIREELRRALERELREAAARAQVSPREVRDYYEANRARFETPTRLRLWRILVDTEEQAKTLLKQAKESGDPKSWSGLAREHSRDKATSMRDGDLGFVRPDGTTDRPRTRVDPALFEAAQKVEDGQFVPIPVKEGSRFAVLWRRGSVGAVKRSLETESANIQKIIVRTRVANERKQLLDKLRQSHVRDVNPTLLDYVQIDSFGSVEERQRPGVLPRRKLRKPQRTERGLR